MRGRVRRKPGLLPIALLSVVAGCQLVGNFSERSTPNDCEGDACAGASAVTAGAAGKTPNGGGGSTTTGDTSGPTGGTTGLTGGTTGRNAGATHAGGTPDQPSDGGGGETSSGANGGEGSHPLRGRPAPCPADPVGTCSILGQVCRSPNGACLCGASTNSGSGGAAGDASADSAGTWSCTECPASRPASGTGCNDFSLDLREGGGALCNYAPGVTCTCAGIAGHWQCGSCPEGKPANGASCGAAGPYSCFYSDSICTCRDSWSCREAEPRCDDFGPSICGLGCRYDAIDQTCSCLGCSCPAGAPQHGSPCVALDLAKPAPCGYAEVSCTCSQNKWSCTGVCPSSVPSNGDTCGAAQQCEYGSSFCVCESGQWSCG
jgi:hypothetical protein